jgi:hypothetical protein
MDNEKFYNKFESLPLEAKRQVLLFIDFLQNKYEVTKKPKDFKEYKLKNEKFFGLWQDRNDIEDSTKWVKNIRLKEWK